MSVNVAQVVKRYRVDHSGTNKGTFNTFEEAIEVAHAENQGHGRYAVTVVEVWTTDPNA